MRYLARRRLPTGRPRQRLAPPTRSHGSRHSGRCHRRDKGRPGYHNGNRHPRRKRPAWGWRKRLLLSGKGFPMLKGGAAMPLQGRVWTVLDKGGNKKKKNTIVCLRFDMAARTNDSDGSMREAQETSRPDGSCKRFPPLKDGLHFVNSISWPQGGGTSYREQVG